MNKNARFLVDDGKGAQGISGAFLSGRKDYHVAGAITLVIPSLLL